MSNLVWIVVIFVGGLIGGFPVAIPLFFLSCFVQGISKQSKQYTAKPKFERPFNTPNTGNFTQSQSPQSPQQQSYYQMWEAAQQRIAHRIQRTASYDSLGIPVTATLPDVKGAYRRAMVQNHPDKTRHLTPVQQKIAVARFREVQEAYNEIKQRSRA